MSSRGPSGAATNLPGGGGKTAVSEDYPPIAWEEIGLNPRAGTNDGQTAAPSSEAWDALLAQSGRPVIAHFYKPEAAGVAVRVERILRSEPQLQDDFDSRVFSQLFVRRMALGFRCVRINGSAADKTVLQRIGIERLPSVLVYDAAGKKLNVLTDGSAASPTEFAKMLDEALKSQGSGACCVNHRQERRTAGLQAVLDAGERLFNEKNYEAAYLKFHEIIMKAHGAPEAELIARAQKRQGDIDRLWLKDPAERKHFQAIQALFRTGIDSLKVKKFPEARTAFVDILEMKKDHMDVHAGMESARMIREIDFLLATTR